MGLVKPQIEYWATVWDPHEDKYTNKNEMVQRRAARCVQNRYHNISGVTEMLDQLGWTSLERHRQEARLSMMYRMVHGLVAIKPLLYLTPVNRVTRSYHRYSFIHCPQGQKLIGSPTSRGQWYSGMPCHPCSLRPALWSPSSCTLQVSENYYLSHA